MHKEQYFTSGNINEKARDLLAYVEPLRQRHKNIVFEPGKAALLVLDMQEYFLQESSHAFIPSATVIVPRIGKLIAAFSNAGCPIFATRHVNTSKDAKMMAKWWRDLINSQTAYSQYINTIKTTQAIHFNKTQYDAFLHTQLENQLHRLKMEQVVISGVMTHLCCETTARSAFMRGFEVFFTVDGTATYNEELHRASLLTLSHGFAVPVLVDELLADMESHAA